MPLTPINEIRDKASAGEYGEDSETIAKLAGLFLAATWDRNWGPFIAGTLGKRRPDGLHEGYVICPCYGADIRESMHYLRADPSKSHEDSPGR